MRLVYQTKIAGAIEAPNMSRNANFALKCAALCPEKTTITGDVLNDETAKTIEIIRENGAKVARKGIGALVVGGKDRRLVYKKIFSEEYEKIGKEAFSAQEFSVPEDFSDDDILALIIGNILFGNSQKITLSKAPCNEEYFRESLNTIKSLGGTVTFDNNEINISNHTTLLGDSDIPIDGDFFIGAFGLSCSALGYGITVNNLYNKNSRQNGAEIINPLVKMGVRLVDEPRGRMYFADTDYKNPIKIDAQKAKNVLPLLYFIATQTYGETEIYNITNEVLDANDRAFFYTVAELKKMGITPVAKRNGTIAVSGTKIFDGGFKINCRQNNMLVLVGILATLCSKKANILENCESIEEKYPKFWDLFAGIGGFAEEE